MKNLKIVLIGGTSKFGQLWKRYFEGKWCEVIVASRTTEITPEEAVTLGNVIIFSVSIRHTVNTIERLIPLIPDNRLVMDFTGIKTDATEALRAYTRGEVVATHPMFGPWTTSLQNQNIAFDPIFPWKKWDTLSELWASDGANLIELPSRKHDELVAIVQSTTHIMSLMLGHVLEKRGIDIAEIMNIATPISRMQLFILARFLNQEASLYTDMQMYNDVYKKEILIDIQQYFKSVGSMVQEWRSSDFEREFNKVKEYIGQDFLDRALKVSSALDEELKKQG